MYKKEIILKSDKSQQEFISKIAKFCCNFAPLSSHHPFYGPPSSLWIFSRFGELPDLEGV